MQSNQIARDDYKIEIALLRMLQKQGLITPKELAKAEAEFKKKNQAKIA